MLVRVAQLCQHRQSALTVCWGVAVQQRQAQRVSGVAQREIVSGSFGDLQRLINELQRGVVGQQLQRLSLLRYVQAMTMEWVVQRVRRAGNGGGGGEVSQQALTVGGPGPSAHPVARGVGERQRRPQDEVALDGVAASQLDDGL